nr:similar to piggyBac-derived 2 (AGAP012114-PA) [Haemonchus contortus]
MDLSHCDDADMEKNFRATLLDFDDEKEGDTDDLQDSQATFRSREDSASNSSSMATLTAKTVAPKNGHVGADTRWDFTQQHGLSNVVSMCSTPIDFFQLFIYDTLLALMETETNSYGSQNESSLMDTDREELKKYFALCIQMGLVKMPKLRDHWSTGPALGGHAFAGKVMPSSRFEQLLRSLHFCDNSAPDRDR